MEGALRLSVPPFLGHETAKLTSCTIPLEEEGYEEEEDVLVYPTFYDSMVSVGDY